MRAGQPRFGLARAMPVVMAFLAVVSGCGRTVERGPIVVLLLDTVRKDEVGTRRNDRDLTPAIDALARDGIVFEQAIAPSGWTLPSVASLLTGVWPATHGAAGKRTLLTKVRDEVPLAAEMFRKGGHVTRAVANAAFVSPLLGFDRGFDIFDHRHAYNWNLRNASDTVDVALPWIGELTGKPFFLLVHFFDPHLDYDPRPGYGAEISRPGLPAPPLTMEICRKLAEEGKDGRPTEEAVRYVRSAHEAEVSFVDAQIARLVAALRKAGLYDGATIVVVADHGEEFWDHGGFEHGHTLYDELLRVPLVIKPPRALGLGHRVVEEQVRMIDVLPTLLEIVGLEPPRIVQGRSLLSLMRGEKDEPRPSLGESTLYGDDRLALRRDGYKLILDLAQSTVELHDLGSDPGETRDVAAARPEITGEMERELMDLFETLTRGLPLLDDAPMPIDLSPEQIERLKSLGYLRE